MVAASNALKPAAGAVSSRPGLPGQLTAKLSPREKASLVTSSLIAPARFTPVPERSLQARHRRETRLLRNGLDRHDARWQASWFLVRGTTAGPLRVEALPRH